MKFSQLMSVVAVAFLISAAGRADTAPAEELGIHLRGLAGVGFLAGADPVSVGASLGAQLDVGIAPRFGLGMIVNHTLGESYPVSIKYQEGLTTFGLRAYYRVSKGAVSATIGPIIGMIARSSTATTYTPATISSSSDSRFAVGMGASLDVILVGPVGLTLTPTFMQSIGGGGKNLTVIAIQAGPYLSF